MRRAADPLSGRHGHDRPYDVQRVVHVDTAGRAAERRSRAGGKTAEEQDLPAGTFSSWLVNIGRAQVDGASVPCGACTACCTSSHFVHVERDETETISRIPAGLLFPAPGLPKGNVVMGYDEDGHCPMFVDGRCSIYEYRPRTCRTYDCRVLPAAGLDLDGEDTSQITLQARRWSFAFPTAQDRRLQEAVQAAAGFLQDHARDLPDGAVPRNPAQLAYLATRIHALFVDAEANPGAARAVTPELDVVEAAIRRARSGEPG